MERVSLLPLFNQSARYGVGCGILFTIMSACLLFSLQVQSLSLIFILLGALGLFFLPYNMAGIVAINPKYCTFPALWVSGLIQFIGGALICGLMTAIYLILIAPDFLSALFHQLIEQLQALDNQNQVNVNDLVIPTPMQFVGSMFWATSFCGSIISLFLGLLLPHSAIFKKLILRQQSKLYNS